MKKRVLPLIMAITMVSGSMVAAAEETAVNDPFGYDFVSQDVDADLTVYRYYADSDKVNLDYAINKMTEKYPNLTFTMEHRTDSEGTALRTWAAVGELPDLMEINSASVYDMFKADGTVYIVDDAVEKTGFYDLFSNGAVAKEARTADDGHQYSYGCEVSNLGGFWYNKELFAELGIEEPTNYEDFKNTLQLLKAAGKVPIALFGAEKWPATNIFSTAVIAEGQTAGLDAVNDGANVRLRIFTIRSNMKTSFCRVLWRSVSRMQTVRSI